MVKSKRGAWEAWVFSYNVALIWSDFALKGEAGLSDSFCLRFI